MQPKAVARVGCCLAIATCAGLGLLAAGPFVRAWWETERAGARLNEALIEAGEQDALPCEMVIGPTPSARHTFDDVVGAIERSAVRTRPALRDRVDFVLAQAMCLNREPERAIPLLHELVAKRPAEPLRHIALAFAYAGLAETCATPGNCDPEAGLPQPEALASIVEGELKMAGSGGAKVAEEAAKAALDGRFHTADRYYRLARASGYVVSGSDSFLWALVEIIARPSPEITSENSAIPIRDLRDELTVAGTDLIWVKAGSALGTYVEANRRGLPGEGIMWFNGAAIIAVQVHAPGTFEVFLRAVDNPPPPTNLQIEHDLAPLAAFSMASGDASMRETRARVMLDQGIHLLGVRFLNDARVGGRDRNAVIVALGAQRVAP